ncbi:MAG: peptidylprolyl isomerase [Clostridia bacterium]|nr:peptidylprolyl isomerase [Clostridia bacterium]
MKKLFALILCLCLISGLASVSAAEGAANPVVRISVYNAGDIYVELYPEIAPITVENFLSLVDQGFYNGLTFHRIIKGFMIQGGDPAGNGTGGSSRKIKGEFSSNGVANDLSHTRGIISMARSSNMDSASSQFFIVHADSTYLDGKYAAFGKVLAGIGIVDRLCATTYVTDTNGTVLTGYAPVITSIVRVDRTEAEEAMAKEAENGKNGTFTEPTTFASFTVPEGWTLRQSANGNAYFVQESELSSSLLLFSAADSFAYAYGINAVSDPDAASVRQNLNTLNVSKTTLMNMIGVTEEDEVTLDIRGSHMFYRTVRDADGTKVSTIIGVENGVVYLFTGTAGMDILLQMLETLVIP